MNAAAKREIPKKSRIERDSNPRPFPELSLNN